MRKYVVRWNLIRSEIQEGLGEGYLKICHPTKRSLNACQAKNIGVGTPILAAIVAAPLLVWEGNVDKRFCRIQDRYRHTLGVKIHLCSTLGFFIVTFVLVIFCYSQVCLVVRRRIQRHKENALKRKHLLQIPAFIQAISNVDDPPGGLNPKLTQGRRKFSLFNIGSSRRLSVIAPWVKARLSLPNDTSAGVTSRASGASSASSLSLSQRKKRKKSISSSAMILSEKGESGADEETKNNTYIENKDLCISSIETQNESGGGKNGCSNVHDGSKSVSEELNFSKSNLNVKTDDVFIQVESPKGPSLLCRQNQVSDITHSFKELQSVSGRERHLNAAFTFTDALARRSLEEEWELEMARVARERRISTESSMRRPSDTGSKCSTTKRLSLLNWLNKWRRKAFSEQTKTRQQSIDINESSLEETEKMVPDSGMAFSSHSQRDSFRLHDIFTTRDQVKANFNSNYPHSAFRFEVSPSTPKTSLKTIGRQKTSIEEQPCLPERKGGNPNYNLRQVGKSPQVQGSSDSTSGCLNLFDHVVCVHQTESPSSHRSENFQQVLAPGKCCSPTDVLIEDKNASACHPNFKLSTGETKSNINFFKYPLNKSDSQIITKENSTHSTEVSNITVRESLSLTSSLKDNIPSYEESRWSKMRRKEQNLNIDVNNRKKGIIFVFKDQKKPVSAKAVSTSTRSLPEKLKAIFSLHPNFSFLDAQLRGKSLRRPISFPGTTSSSKIDTPSNKCKKNREFLCSSFANAQTFLNGGTKHAFETTGYNRSTEAAGRNSENEKGYKSCVAVKNIKDRLLEDANHKQESSNEILTDINEMNRKDLPHAQNDRSHQCLKNKNTSEENLILSHIDSFAHNDEGTKFYPPQIFYADEKLVDPKYTRGKCLDLDLKTHCISENNKHGAGKPGIITMESTNQAKQLSNPSYTEHFPSTESYAFTKGNKFQSPLFPALPLDNSYFTPQSAPVEDHNAKEETGDCNISKLTTENLFVPGNIHGQCKDAKKLCSSEQELLQTSFSAGEPHSYCIYRTISENSCFDEKSRKNLFSLPNNPARLSASFVDMHNSDLFRRRMYAAREKKIRNSNDKRLSLAKKTENFISCNDRQEISFDNTRYMDEEKTDHCSCEFRKESGLTPITKPNSSTNCYTKLCDDGNNKARNRKHCDGCNKTLGNNQYSLYSSVKDIREPKIEVIPYRKTLTRKCCEYDSLKDNSSKPCSNKKTNSPPLKATDVKISKVATVRSLNVSPNFSQHTPLNPEKPTTISLSQILNKDNGDHNNILNKFVGSHTLYSPLDKPKNESESCNSNVPPSYPESQTSPPLLCGGNQQKQKESKMQHIKLYGSSAHHFVPSCENRNQRCISHQQGQKMKAGVKEDIPFDNSLRPGMQDFNQFPLSLPWVYNISVSIDPSVCMLCSVLYFYQRNLSFESAKPQSRLIYDTTSSFPYYLVKNWHLCSYPSYGPRCFWRYPDMYLLNTYVLAPLSTKDLDDFPQVKSGLFTNVQGFLKMNSKCSLSFNSPLSISQELLSERRNGNLMKNHSESQKEKSFDTEVNFFDLGQVLLKNELNETNTEMASFSNASPMSNVLPKNCHSKLLLESEVLSAKEFSTRSMFFGWSDFLVPSHSNSDVQKMSVVNDLIWYFTYCHSTRKSLLSWYRDVPCIETFSCVSTASLNSLEEGVYKSGPFLCSDILFPVSMIATANISGIQLFLDEKERQSCSKSKDSQQDLPMIKRSLEAQETDSPENFFHSETPCVSTSNRNDIVQKMIEPKERRWSMSKIVGNTFQFQDKPKATYRSTQQENCNVAHSSSALTKSMRTSLRKRAVIAAGIRDSCMGETLVSMLPVADNLNTESQQNCSEVPKTQYNRTSCPTGIPFPPITTKAVHSALLKCVPTLANHDPQDLPFEQQSKGQSFACASASESVANTPTTADSATPSSTCEIFVRSIFDAFVTGNGFFSSSEPCLPLFSLPGDTGGPGEEENMHPLDVPLTPLLTRNDNRRKSASNRGNKGEANEPTGEEPSSNPLLSSENRLFQLARKNREALFDSSQTFTPGSPLCGSPTVSSASGTNTARECSRSRKQSTLSHSWFSLDDLESTRKPSRFRLRSFYYLNSLRHQIERAFSVGHIRSFLGLGDTDVRKRKTTRKATRDTLVANQINVIITRCESIVLDKSSEELGNQPLRDRSSSLDPSPLDLNTSNGGSNTVYDQSVSDCLESWDKNLPRRANYQHRHSADAASTASSHNRACFDKMGKPRAASLDTARGSSFSQSDDMSSRGASLDLLSPASASGRTGSVCSGISTLSRLTECSAYTENSRSDCERITRRSAEREHNITKLLGVITFIFVISWSVSWCVIIGDTLGVIPGSSYATVTYSGTGENDATSAFLSTIETEEVHAQTSFLRHDTASPATHLTISLARNLFLVNHFCNIVVYAWLSKSFREKLAQCYKIVLPS
ncbi:hypothetical protein PoB_003400500 [Plakobranchus ocellatus]|uniref:Transmembrane protein n=1 Tax=Plakobranchus ocellatus TaxID=259542 RepID=A0AAV4AKV3_9GAST|nr:hypothetical protein PoB_003400500 [Plakobranchus ocellatus]